MPLGTKSTDPHRASLARAGMQPISINSAVGLANRTLANHVIPATLRNVCVTFGMPIATRSCST